jgi:hypothetical protein
VHPEDGNFNVHQNTATASTHDMAKPQKLRVNVQKTEDQNNVNFHGHCFVLCHPYGIHGSSANIMTGITVCSRLESPPLEQTC